MKTDLTPVVRTPGIFTISLDFELYWGVRDKRTIDQYRSNLSGVRSAVTQMLQTFSGTKFMQPGPRLDSYFAKIATIY